MKILLTVPLVLLPALWAGCTSSPMQAGYTVPGCYDHKGYLEPTIHTPAECSVASWVWRSAPWQGSPAKQ